MAKPAILLFEDVSVDTEKLFIPAALTPLFHTSCYGNLTADQRRRYNRGSARPPRSPEGSS
ncbi:MAG TPA: hypothetical protein VGP73_04535 [Thermoanaerobaculia bacterium]